MVFAWKRALQVCLDSPGCYQSNGGSQGCRCEKSSAAAQAKATAKAAAAAAASTAASRPIYAKAFDQSLNELNQ